MQEEDAIMPSPAARRSPVPPATPDAIEEGLRQLFRSVADEPLPDEFADLLRRMDEATAQPAGSAGPAPKAAETPE